MKVVWIAKGSPLGELANPQDLTERARLLPLCDVPFPSPFLLFVQL